MTRRTFIAGTAMAVPVTNGLAADPAWKIEAEESAILARIRSPEFPARDFHITRYGAKPGGDVNCTEAIRRAIAVCAEAGGGRVVVPAGVFLTGAIHLKSGVNLHVAQGATLRFSRDPKEYLPQVFTRWEGTECMNYSSFVYAFEQTNIAITGKGILDGQASCEFWWPWKGRTNCGWKKGEPNQAKARARLQELAEKNVPAKDRIFGENDYLRPQFIQMYRCTNVLIEGVTIKDSPMWEIHPVLSKNVNVRNVTVSSHGPNNDGCDPESCTDVLIEGCTFDTGDDCIAIKSGRNEDGRRLHVPCENLVITRCTMKDGHGGVSIGSEASGGVRNVYIRDCRMSSPNLERALRIKTNSYRGGVIENVSFRNITVGQVAEDLVQVDFTYEEGAGGPFQPVVRNINIEDVACGTCGDPLFLRGYASAPIRNVRVARCRFERALKPSTIEHVEGLQMNDVLVNGKPVKS